MTKEIEDDWHQLYNTLNSIYRKLKSNDYCTNKLYTNFSFGLKITSFSPYLTQRAHSLYNLHRLIIYLWAEDLEMLLRQFSSAATTILHSRWGVFAEQSNQMWITGWVRCRKGRQFMISWYIGDYSCYYIYNAKRCVCLLRQFSYR